MSTLADEPAKIISDDVTAVEEHGQQNGVKIASVESEDDREASKARNDMRQDSTPRNGEADSHTQPAEKSEGKDDSATARLSDNAAASAPSQDIMAQVLKFVADASDEVLVAILVAAAAVVYLILGGLGVGLLVGAAGTLHYTGQIQAAGTTTRDDDLQQYQREQIVEPVEEDMEDSQATGFSDFRPETAAALDELVNATIGDFMAWWYISTIPEASIKTQRFTKAAEAELVTFLRSIARALSRKRPADILLEFLTNTTSKVLPFLGELSSAIKDSQEVDVAPEDAVQLYLTDKPDSRLAYILDEQQQRKKFGQIANDLLRNFIAKDLYHCNMVKTFLQEELSLVAMEMSLRSMSKPEWLNGWIVYLLEEGEPDFIQAIDAGMSNESKAAMKPKITTENEKRMSKAEDAMQEAMDEARRLSELIAEEDMRRARESAASSPAPATIAEKKDEVAKVVPKKAENLPTEPNFDGFSDSSDSEARTKSDSASDTQQKSAPTSFDQIVPETKLSHAAPPSPEPAPPFTLHNASITILDDGSDGKSRLRSKPSDDYLVQIEPQDSRHPGWMIVRRYDDFETLHEVLKRIAQVSGASSFSKNHATLPAWKNETRAGLRTGLENYLISACHYQALAESVGLKRFLEKEHQGPTGKGSPGIGWPTPAAFESMGKGLVDNLMSASKGAAEGGKSVFGGMTGVFGNRSRSDSKASLKSRQSRSSPSLAAPSPFDDLSNSNGTSIRPVATSVDSTEPEPHAPEPVLVNTNQEPVLLVPAEENTATRNSISSDSKPVVPSDGSTSETASVKSGITKPEIQHIDLDALNLPPPPSDMPDEYHGGLVSSPTLTKSTLAAAGHQYKGSTSMLYPEGEVQPKAKKPKQISHQPISESETIQSLDLIFDLLSALYTLSSVWGLRKTLLIAARRFLLRPGNPSLSAIQALIQESVLVPNTSDAGIAAQLRTIRKNAVPTEEELKEWPPEMEAWEKEKLRTKARALLLERGVPPALMGIMGSQATGEAVERVFDALQDERVLRGLMFEVLCQGIAVLTR